MSELMNNSFVHLSIASCNLLKWLFFFFLVWKEKDRSMKRVSLLELLY